MQSKFYTQKNTGFMALISAIIISVLLITLGVTSSMTSFFARYDIANAEYKERSTALAEACADLALSKLAIDSTYSPAVGGDIETVDTDRCTIISISTNSGLYTITTKANFPATPPASYATIEIKANTSNLSLISWREI